MSKAFVNEDADVPDAGAEIVRRTESQPITPAGLARLAAEHRALLESGKESRRLLTLANVLETIYVVEPSVQDGRAGFGARVTLETEDGERLVYELVGPDEAEPREGRISASSVVARALLGKRKGDEVTLRRPKGDVEVVVLDVALPDER